jgi:uncharacterized protein with beta-barrel porin domain
LPAAPFAGATPEWGPCRVGYLALAVICLLGAAIAPAFADCQPASPASGQTVNCTGNAPTGFQVTNPAVNNLNVIVQPGATVHDNGFFSIVVNNGNTVVNNGTVTGGAGVTGIGAIDGNAITNNSVVIVGDGGVGLFVNNNSTVNNAVSGTITAGNSATGIQITGTGSSATNAGSIVAGDNGLGVDVSGADVGTKVVNNGSIVVGAGSACCSGIGIFLNAGQTATNNGTITTGDGATGVFAIGDNNIIINTKAINVGAGAAAIGMFGNAETVTSSGTITGGLTSFGIAGNDNNTIIHAGTMTLGDSATGIQLRNNNAVANSGAITVGQFGAGILVGNNNTVTNGGTMTIGELGIAIEAVHSNHIVNGGTINLAAGTAGIIVFGAHNNVINGGTMNVGDGGVGLASVAVAGSQNVLTNNGLITLASSSCCTSATGISAGAGTLGTNNKSIIGGDNTEGMVGFGGGNTLINNGNITLGASTLGHGLSVGIDVSAVGGDTVTNNGSITAGALGIGIATGHSNVITNNGTVVVGPNAVSIGNCGCFSSNHNTVVNNGTLDGAVNLTGLANSFTNNGLITITDPGTATGAKHVIDGDFVQTVSGTLALRVTSAGVSDALTVSGTATLGGTLKPVVQTGLYGATTTYFGVVTAGNPIGTQFAQVTSPSAFLTATAIYHPNSVDLTLKRIAFGSLAGETQNQQAVGNALERAYSTALTGAAATFFSNLLVAPSFAMFDQFSGEGTSATQNTAFSAGDQFMAALIDQYWLWRNGDRTGIPDTGATPLGYAAQARMHPAFKAIPMAAPAFVPSWHGWAAGFGGSQSFNADPVVGSALARNSTGGAAVGVDYTVNPDLLLGVGVGGSASSFAVPDRATFGTVDGGHVGFYGMQRRGAAYATALVSYSRFDSTTTRTIAGLGPTEVAGGSFASDLFGARFEIGRTWNYRRIGLTPFAAVQVSELWQRGYSETSMVVGGGPGVLGLNFAPVSVTSLPTFLGAQLDTSVTFANGMVWSPFARAAWVHEFDPTRQVTAAFLLVPGASFAVDGARAASDSARIDLGSRLKITRRAALTATFTGEFSDRTQSYAGRAGLRMEF